MCALDLAAPECSTYGGGEGRGCYKTAPLQQHYSAQACHRWHHLICHQNQICALLPWVLLFSGFFLVAWNEPADCLAYLDIPYLYLSFTDYYRLYSEDWWGARPFFCLLTFSLVVHLITFFYFILVYFQSTFARPDLQSCFSNFFLFNLMDCYSYCCFIFYLLPTWERFSTNMKYVSVGTLGPDLIPVLYFVFLCLQNKQL